MGVSGVGGSSRVISSSKRASYATDTAMWLKITGHPLSGLRSPIRQWRTAYCSLLFPTEQSTGLPFHIDADFFPASDRKSIAFGDSYDPRSEWNRAALKAAASVVAANLISHTRHAWARRRRFLAVLGCALQDTRSTRLRRTGSIGSFLAVVNTFFAELSNRPLGIRRVAQALRGSDSNGEGRGKCSSDLR